MPFGRNTVCFDLTIQGKTKHYLLKQKPFETTFYACITKSLLHEFILPSSPNFLTQYSNLYCCSMDTAPAALDFVVVFVFFSSFLPSHYKVFIRQTAGAPTSVYNCRHRCTGIAVIAACMCLYIPLVHTTNSYASILSSTILLLPS